MQTEIALNCDFCNKTGLTISEAGILYCNWCHKSYGEQIATEYQMEQALKDIGRRG